jgi:hypothetical protein
MRLHVNEQLFPEKLIAVLRHIKTTVEAYGCSDSIGLLLSISLLYLICPFVLFPEKAGIMVDLTDAQK